MKKTNARQNSTKIEDKKSSNNNRVEGRTPINAVKYHKVSRREGIHELTILFSKNVLASVHQTIALS